MKKLLPLLLAFGCTEVIVTPDLQVPPIDMSSIEKDLLSPTIEDLSIAVEDLAVNIDLSTPYEILCPAPFECCTTGLLYKYADKFTCIFPAIAHLDHVGQSCDGGYLSVFVWCY